MRLTNYEHQHIKQVFDQVFGQGELTVRFTCLAVVSMIQKKVVILICSSSQMTPQIGLLRKSAF